MLYGKKGFGSASIVIYILDKNTGVNSLVMPHNRGVLRLLVPYGTCNANRGDSLYMTVHKLLIMLYAKTYGTS